MIKSWYKKRKRDEEQEDEIQPKRRKIKAGEAFKKKDQAGQEEHVKAVIFVPYTRGSTLAKRMREAEVKLQSMTGYRLKVVERSGTKLQDILHKSDPWQGQDCERPDCLLCKTKLTTGKNTSQDCSKRSLVYETWCMTFLERDEIARYPAQVRPLARTRL